MNDRGAGEERTVFINKQQQNKIFPELITNFFCHQLIYFSFCSVIMCFFPVYVVKNRFYARIFDFVLLN